MRIVSEGLRKIVLATVCWIACEAPANSDSIARTVPTPGGFTTSEWGANAFAIPVSALNKQQAEKWAAGKSQFNEAWVVAPDPSGVWGLGPTFNEIRCAQCHVSNGRASAPQNGADAERGLVIRLSVAGQTKQGAPQPDPTYGDQLQNRGTHDRVPAEGRVVVTYSSRDATFEDGERVALRVPNLYFEDLNFGPLSPGIMTSARIAPAMIGMGLLESVPEATILRLAASQPVDQRGTPNYVWDYENERKTVGRFGWKANQPSLRQQIAAAFLADIGATSMIFGQDNCPSAQKDCLHVPSSTRCSGETGCSGNFRPEVAPSRLANITLYLQGLAVPERRNPGDSTIERGEALFMQAQCSVCHVPALQTGETSEVSATRNITFHAFTDLLLHDMGDELADNRPDFQATGREWRTAPLWGIGLLRTVNGHTDLLHDGRARNIAEAVLWHGGQAAKSRGAFRAMSKGERAALVRFIESL